VPGDDRVLSAYTRPASVWSTVTPVVLPGHDEADPKTRARRREKAATTEDRQTVDQRADARTEGLLRTAIVQAGFPAELAQAAELDWRPVGFRPGVDLAHRYEMPDYLRRFPRYHVRLRWKSASGDDVAVRGPIVIGAGRYCGFGLFAAEDGSGGGRK
jgi:CRISPR-associated protein Csb2